jgi:glycosyltransferase involved in cell wall biosynthesis
MYQPDITIVITNYNKGKFINRAVRSCLSQDISRRRVEVIVVDDCSTDESIVELTEFIREVKIIKLNENRGVAHASNVGLEHSTSDYWMRVDGDDYLSSSALTVLAPVLDYNEDFDYVYCDHIRIDMRGHSIGRISLSNQDTLLNHGAGILFRRHKLVEVGGYDDSLRNAEDYDLLLRLMLNHSKGFHIPIPLYRYYIHGSNLTLSGGREGAIRQVRERYGI